MESHLHESTFKRWDLTRLLFQCCMITMYHSFLKLETTTLPLKTKFESGMIQNTNRNQQFRNQNKLTIDVHLLWTYICSVRLQRSTITDSTVPISTNGLSLLYTKVVVYRLQTSYFLSIWSMIVDIQHNLN
jgi:hypothetical protein